MIKFVLKENAKNSIYQNSRAFKSMQNQFLQIQVSVRLCTECPDVRFGLLHLGVWNARRCIRKRFRAPESHFEHSDRRKNTGVVLWVSKSYVGAPESCSECPKTLKFEFELIACKKSDRYSKSNR